MTNANQQVTEVTKDEFLAMATRASEEIKQLRAQIAFLMPKAQAYDCLATVLGMLQGSPQGMTEDLAGLLDRRVKFLSSLPEPKKAPSDNAKKA
ncbi:hypothetical protein [Neorhizobium petrolearium]|uniref:hypothetical protein n=1 Tax=Neorhizobium petrolearium TaxID=515361 RepID=UPI003F157481